MEGGRDWWPTFDVKFRNAKIPNLHFCRWGGGGVGGQLLMQSPKMLQSQILIFAGMEGWWSTFDAESKNAKKSQIHIFTGGRGGLGSQLLMLNPKMLKSQIHILADRECWWPTFDAESKNAKINKFTFSQVGQGD